MHDMTGLYDLRVRRLQMKRTVVIEGVMKMRFDEIRTSAER